MGLVRGKSSQGGGVAVRPRRLALQEIEDGRLLTLDVGGVAAIGTVISTSTAAAGRSSNKADSDGTPDDSKRQCAS